MRVGETNLGSERSNHEKPLACRLLILPPLLPAPRLTRVFNITGDMSESPEPMNYIATVRTAFFLPELMGHNRNFLMRWLARLHRCFVLRR